jgi:hypothetical protein
LTRSDRSPNSPPWDVKGGCDTGLPSCIFLRVTVLIMRTTVPTNGLIESRMFESLPSEAVALRSLLADLHDGLEGRVARLRLLVALELDFGNGKGLMLPGGTPVEIAYIETRSAFVTGNFMSVILISQCLLENILAAQLEIDAVSLEIHGGFPTRQKERPLFRDTVAACKSSRLLNDEDERDLMRLADLRNALSHFRTLRDPSHIDRRSLYERQPAADICEADARFAIGVLIRVLAKPAFGFKLDSADRSDNL